MKLRTQDTKNLINGKPSNRVVEGNVNSGFKYTINWYTDNSASMLECANINFDKEIMDKMVSLADKIDKEQPKRGEVF